jgi:hypothetical protein
MREVLDVIEQRTAQLRSGPFLRWLADETVPPTERLMAWLPGAAPWVFGFMDLNDVLLRYPDDEARQDPYKRAINDHLDEDARHWVLYLEDLRRLGLDVALPLPDLLGFLWGRETLHQRLAVYELAALAAQAGHPLVRYALIAALEACAHLLFDTLMQVSSGVTRSTGTEVLYVGSVHAAKEPGHLANQSTPVEARMRAEVLDDPVRHECLRIVHRVADVVAERWAELHRFARAHGHARFLRSA